jgi:ABC-type transporter Mla subunit MlaD
MSDNHNAFKAGLFMFIALILGVSVFIGIRGAGSFFADTTPLTIVFNIDDNLGGLKIGDTIRIGGYDQGRVTAIEFVNHDTAPKFYIRATLPAYYNIREDAIVQVEQGLTGTSNLNISSVGVGKPYTPGMLLKGMPSALSQFYAIAPDARGLVKDIRSKVEPIYIKYETVMNKADTALTTADAALVNARDLLGDTKTDIRTTLANLNITSGSLKDRLPRIMDKLDTLLTTTTQTIDGAKGTLEDIRVAAANTKGATAEARSLLTRNRSKIDKMIESLRDTSTNLEATSAEVRRSPWRLLYTPKKDEIANLNLYDSARLFSEAATQLNDSATAVRDALDDKDMPKEKLDELMKGLSDSFAKYQDVEKALWQAVKQ